VRELLEKGSIKGDDELCSGNGYWFFVREKELVEKYVVGDIKQGYNPVSEAESVLTQQVLPDNVYANSLMPSEDDLEYPDDLGESNSAGKIPLDEDLTYPDPVLDEFEEEAHTINKLREKSIDTEKKKILNKKIKSSTQASSKMTMDSSSNSVKAQKSFLNQNLLYLLAMLFFILALLAFYYRKRIIKEVIDASLLGVSPVYAQVLVMPESVKKKLIF
jgi:hypothetical protein